MRKTIIKIYIGLLIFLIACLAVYFITGTGIPCYYYTRLGRPCPGCGLSRMYLSMLQLDFAAAFGYNPVGFVATFLWNIVAVLCFWGKVPFVQRPAFLYTLLGITIGAFLIFGFVRNVL